MTDEENQNPDEVSLEQALAMAINLHQLRQLEQAEAVYQWILQQLPDCPEALHFLGMLRHQQGKDDEAVALIEHALAAAPDYADAYNNLGNIYRLQDKPELAVESYRKTLALNPQNSAAYNNLGILLKDLAQFDEAIEALGKAIELMPDNPDFYRNLGNALKNRGSFADAVKAYRGALSLRSYNAEDYEHLAVLLYMQRNYDEAIPLIKQWLELDPENPLAKHRLAAFSGEQLSKASDDYISQTFDSFADSFDRVLKKLDYKAPFLVADAVEKLHGTPAAHLAILDAGCGTGLCGPLIKDFASQLTGIDLSAKMLQRAEKRGCYHELAHSELVAWIAGQTAAYDLIISADTLVYFGDLNPVCQVVTVALKNQGHFIFTLESSDEPMADGYKIHPHGRFSHAEPYIRTTLSNNGLSLIDLNPVMLRYEGGLPVNGLLVVAKLD